MVLIGFTNVVPDTALSNGLLETQAQLYLGRDLGEMWSVSS